MPTALYVDRQQFKSITPKVGRPKKFTWEKGKFYYEIKKCNYSDPLCNVENLRDGVIYKDDFNGLRDSLIYA